MMQQRCCLYLIRIVEEQEMERATRRCRTTTIPNEHVETVEIVLFAVVTGIVTCKIQDQKKRVLKTMRVWQRANRLPSSPGTPKVFSCAPHSTTTRDVSCADRNGA